MGWYSDRLLPRLVDAVLGQELFSTIRQRVAAGLSGEVLEIGFGSGLNVPHYPPAVRRVRAVDPAVAGRRLAARRLAESPVPVEFIGRYAEELPLEARSIDAVLCTWTLCSIPGVDQALREVFRVLRPGGTFHFVEHGRSLDPKVAVWQDRLTPLQRIVAGGCHLNRPIDELVAQSGLVLQQVERSYLRGPRPLTYTFEGVAIRP